MRRPLGVLGALTVTVLGLALPMEAGSASVVEAVAAPTGDAFSATRTVERTFVEADGSTRTVSSHDVTVVADHTQNLRGRERVLISWSGAQPSGGRASNPFGENGLQQEYPVVVMQCRGTDDPDLPDSEQLRPETCWTASVAQRSQTLRSNSESTWVHDVHNSEADKQRVSGMDPIPTEECPSADIAPYFTHLTEFVAADGTVYPGCDADSMPPEAAVGAAFPAAEIAAFTDSSGRGEVQFEVRSDVENESLGCNDTVACSIVVIPIAGISCDAPAASPSLADRSCRKQGRFPPGSSNFANDGIDVAVGPALWWSESNWRNRFTIPVTFGLPPDTCDVLDPRAPTGFYGSELLAQAALQWSPAYCLNKGRFKFQLNQLSDVAGFNLMLSGEGPAAVVSSQHENTGSDPVGYAPTAVTGFSIGYVIDRPDNAGEYAALRLNARLLAKLLTQSYLGSDLGRAHPGMAGNPLSIVTDPEFVALNPGLTSTNQEAAATILSLSNASDVIEQVTEYIADDDEAMAFVNGEPDPSGMVVNPAYQGLRLPLQEIPLLDTFVPETQNTCRQANPSVYFSQLAAPVTTMRKIAESLLDAWPNVQTRCEFDLSTQQFKTGRIERQSFGSRFMLGIVSLGDVERYGLRSAALETKPGTFVAPSDKGLANAVALTEQQDKRGPFVLDQADVSRSGSAYPGTMIVYTAAKVRGLDEESAAKVAQFIRVATGEGQQVGSGNGQLPGGYLPIRSTGPTSKLYHAARAVADAVEAQAPARTPDPPAPVDPPTEPVDEPTDAPASTTPPPIGTVPDLGVADLDPPGTSDPATAPDPGGVPVAGEAPVGETVPTAATRAETSGIAGKLFPMLLLAGFLGLMLSTGSRFFVRPPRVPS